MAIDDRLQQLRWWYRYPWWIRTDFMRIHHEIQLPRGDFHGTIVVPQLKHWKIRTCRRMFYLLFIDISSHIICCVFNWNLLYLWPYRPILLSGGCLSHQSLCRKSGRIQCCETMQGCRPSVCLPIGREHFGKIHQVSLDGSNREKHRNVRKWETSSFVAMFRGWVRQGFSEDISATKIWKNSVCSCPQSTSGCDPL